MHKLHVVPPRRHSPRQHETLPTTAMVPPHVQTGHGSNSTTTCTDWTQYLLDCTAHDCTKTTTFTKLTQLLITQATPAFQLVSQVTHKIELAKRSKHENLCGHTRKQDVPCSQPQSRIKTQECLHTKEESMSYQMWDDTFVSKGKGQAKNVKYIKNP